MNTECGGYLLIGVKDDKTILGLENDYKVLIKNHSGKSLQDVIHLHFGNIIDDYLGGENGPHVTMRFHEKDGKTIALAVIPKKAPKEVYLTLEGEPSFYVRSGNSSRPLDVKQTNAYIRSHWGNR